MLMSRASSGSLFSNWLITQPTIFSLSLFLVYKRILQSSSSFSFKSPVFSLSLHSSYIFFHFDQNYSFLLFQSFSLQLFLLPLLLFSKSQHFPSGFISFHQNPQNKVTIFQSLFSAGWSMGFSEKPQVDGGFESDNSRKWLIAGIALRAPLKPIYTTVPVEKTLPDGGDTDQECSTTPTSEEARIPTPLTCPPAPRKRRPSTKCGYNGGGREFFNPPDLETVFIRNVERAN